ncbi:MAG: hypothetical protein QXS17_02440 [Candidatus Micrarchaeaceae archaeon]
MSKTVLLLGFGQFLSYNYNPSGSIAKKLNGKSIKGFKIIGKVLPVEHISTSTFAEKYITETHPSIILGLGLSAMRGSISIERVALNRFYFTSENKTIDEPLSKKGKPAYFSTIPVDSIKSKIERAGIPAEYSFWPDTFVSNELFYTIMKIAHKIKAKYAGFIHLPLTHEQVIEKKWMHYGIRANVPSLTEKEETEAIKIALEVCIQNL